MKSQHRQQDLKYGVSLYYSHQVPLSAGCPLHKVLNWDLGSQRPAEGSDYPGFSQTSTKSSLFPKICPPGDTCNQAVPSSFRQYRNPRTETFLAGIASGFLILLTFPLPAQQENLFSLIRLVITYQCTEAKQGHNPDLVVVKDPVYPSLHTGKNS